MWAAVRMVERGCGNSNAAVLYRDSPVTGLTLRSMREWRKRGRDRQEPQYSRRETEEATDGEFSCREHFEFVELCG